MQKVIIAIKPNKRNYIILKKPNARLVVQYSLLSLLDKLTNSGIVNKI